jgi:hypothetical protein
MLVHRVILTTGQKAIPYNGGDIAAYRPTILSQPRIRCPDKTVIPYFSGVESFCPQTTSVQIQTSRLISLFPTLWRIKRVWSQSRPIPYVAGSIPDEVTGFFSWPNPSSLTMTLRSAQPLTEMSNRDHPGGKGWPAHKAENLTATCDPIV